MRSSPRLKLRVVAFHRSLNSTGRLGELGVHTQHKINFLPSRTQSILLLSAVQFVGNISGVLLPALVAGIAGGTTTYEELSL
jgi:hypothetical protein